MAGNGQGWASPGPASLAALGVAATAFGFSYLGKVPVEGLPIIGAWMLGAFLIQFLTAIIELKDGHLTGGNVMLFFSAFFMLATAVGSFAKFMMIKNGIAPVPAVEGYLWLSGTIFLTLLAPAYLKNSSSLMFIMVAMVVLALWMIVGIDTGWFGNPAVLKNIAAYILLLVGLCGNYMAGASLVNGAFGRPVLPIPGPVIK